MDTPFQFEQLTIKDNDVFPEQGLFTDLPADYEPTFPGAQALDRDDIDTARRVLRRLSNPGDPNETVHTLAVRTQQALLRRMEATTDLDPGSFLKTVLRDYNYYRRG